MQYLENLLSLEAKALLRVSLKCIYTYTHVQMALFLLLQGVTLQNLRSGRSSPLTSPVLQDPARYGGCGTSKSKHTHVQSLIDSASHSLILKCNHAGVTLQKMSLRSGRTSLLTSPVLQEPAKRGGRGTSKSKRVQNLMDSASHSLVPFKI